MNTDLTLLNQGSAAETKGSARNAPVHVVRAVQQASDATGVDFAYLMDKAGVESGYRTDVKASTSSATGLFQFTEGTWLNMVEQHGAKYGLGVYADKINNGSVSDPQTRREILNLRKDPRLSAIFAAELANDNKTHLENELGRPVGNTELYMAHFLGAGGAAKFLKALDKNPNQPAASLLPDAAKANLNVFYDGTRPKSVGQIFDNFAAKFDGAPAQFAGSTSLGTVQSVDNSSQPWLTGNRSAASGKEPISTFTIMMLDSLALPSTDEEEKKRSTGSGARDSDEGDASSGKPSNGYGMKVGPNLSAGSLIAA
ncbi:hypothetical protein CHU95_18555 [Niveispirillum lacus]|uniref:Transglycosylase SLT domain-containing protein n=1 Tax=Niveispirillum lacus TaxID=1981099 RepID=A0A255YU48_9PROT|nr:hypothetical protein [Niveispirillum lacus]OYQ32757.1 hypothetical protein CHU95_18555 [Niveispirillum lacus]